MGRGTMTEVLVCFVRRLCASAHHTHCVVYANTYNVYIICSLDSHDISRAASDVVSGLLSAFLGDAIIFNRMCGLKIAGS